MAAVTPAAQPGALVEPRATIGLRRTLLDVHLLAKRNLMKVLRKPRFIIFSTLQPIMQLILFVFVFGSIAQLQGLGLTYKDFVVPAVIIQTMTFTGVQSGIGIADDMNTGMIDRFRSLPIARAAFLLGRTASDTARLTFQVLLLVGTALVIGFRFQNGVVSGVGMVVIAILFGMALVTFSEYVGLAVKDPETVQAAMFIPLLPLVFTSSAFAPISRLPGWMQPFAKVNPVTAAIDTARGLAIGDDKLYQVSQVHLSTAFVRFGITWVVIMVLFTFLAVRQWRKS
jgi:ABC-2 type transport system permease protein